MAKLHIGLSGYSYPTWKGEGRFYPPDVPASKFLQYYGTRYNAVEMDGTFYKNPTEKAVEDWIKRTPEGFVFSFKVHRRITHLARLKLESIESVNFMLPRLVPMVRDGRLGPLLIQLPPNFKRNDERLAHFCSLLPQNLAHVQGGTEKDKLRWGMEFRHESWNDEAVEEILRNHSVAWVASDRPVMAAQKRDTAGFIYARLRQDEYDDAALKKWASYFGKAIEEGKDCFVYCKHEDEGSPWIWADFILRQLA